MYKVLLFGAGIGLKDLLCLLDFKKVKILACVDNNEAIQGKSIENIEIISPHEVMNYNFNYIIITNKYFDEIFQQLVGLGVEKEKIVGTKLSINSNLCCDKNKHIEILNQFTSQPIEPYVNCNIHTLGRERLIDVYHSGDYVRLSSLELVAKEIYEKNVNGSVAELGVYRGDFAKYINEVFFDRKLYLFDTFSGFAESDLLVEQQNNLSQSHSTDFSNTNVEVVLSNMKYPDNCIIKKGYFPNTAEGIDELFSFVSIDADLFNPIYAGLSFFYPRLAKDGYIFIHDYNNSRFIGAKEAVRKYCDENSINYFPLSDISGSAIITK
ncbi:TylF/MycF/NovP-related O-methyltransferase [Caldifermentibacillus hisashii]|uniref:TylF/MycF/NovP-related O-methyltransferase n=1 Tax=Caldifermentibacillus hisashii TaxID=996558 RepID=UPI002E210BE7|nr:TylF/MycF/NovP-related O-methyltransferase [Caldifermentibacillus hisashii]